MRTYFVSTNNSVLAERRRAELVMGCYSWGCKRLVELKTFNGRFFRVTNRQVLGTHKKCTRHAFATITTVYLLVLPLPFQDTRRYACEHGANKLFIFLPFTPILIILAGTGLRIVIVCSIHFRMQVNKSLHVDKCNPRVTFFHFSNLQYINFTNISSN